MGARVKQTSCRRGGRGDELGQSVLEFLLTLPLLVGLAILMLRINSAIQVSIVNQQYARAQTLWLTFNSPIYPERTHRATVGNEAPYNQMVIGVSQNSSPRGESDEVYEPEAATQMITRTRALAGVAGSPQEEPDTRGIVRIRDTVSLCTQSNAVMSQGKMKDPGPNGLSDPFDPKAFQYCRSPDQ